jgi:tellurite resistance protein
VILFGVRGRTVALGSGPFFCPLCRGDRQYARRGIRRWFTLFFVPVVALGGPTGTRICCETCGGAFSEEVLLLPTADAFAEVYRRALRQCVVAVLKAGAPSSSVARASALSAINAAAAGGADVDDAALDAALLDADPDELAVAANPVANRLGPTHAERFFGACAHVALADGPLSDGERRALGMLGESLHLTEVHQLGVIESLRAPVEPALGAGTDEA